MKSLLNNREIVFKNFYDSFFSIYPKTQIVFSVKKILFDLLNKDDVSELLIRNTLDDILNKTETFNTLLTLYELEESSKNDKELLNSMNDPSYNQHRTLAMNICDMYSSGASSLFGYIDCLFHQFFPNHPTRSFLSKGVCALVASAAEVLITGDINDDYTNKNLDILNKRGVTIHDLSKLVYNLQKPYNSKLTTEDCKEHVLGVLRKQQTYHTIELCYKIDKGVENEDFGKQFNSIVGNDEGLYGLDETLNTSISKMYGMIAITNFGYLDKAKPGIIGKLDSDHEGNRCNTFIDDTVCAIVAAACSRLAHNNKNTQSKPKK